MAAEISNVSTLPTRQALREARRVVVKVGTRVLARDDGRPALTRLAGIIEQLADLNHAGREVLLVSSGAVGLGRERLKLEAPLTPEQRQMCAAVGQMPLVSLYESGFQRFGIVCAQILLTRGDFGRRDSYLRLRATMENLVRHGVVPIINENDVVATEEVDEQGADLPDVSAMTFGNNDQLSALVAAKLDADMLVLLTDVPGVYSDDPRTSPNARLIDEITPTEESDGDGAPTLGGGNDVSRGGMRSKVAAAYLAAHSGCHAVIASGLEPLSLQRVAAGERLGTWFHAREALAAWRRWIAFASAPVARLVLDAGAVEAIRDRGASLLAVGVAEIMGAFDAGDVVELCDGRGEVLGRGVTNYDVTAARAWMAGERPEDLRNHDALIHRDNLALAPSETADASA